MDEKKDKNQFKHTERLDELEKKLYRDEGLSEETTNQDYHFLNQEEKDSRGSIAGFWPSYKTPKGKKILPTISSDMKNKFLKKILILSFLAFLGSLSVFLYVVIGDRNTISAQNILIDVVAPKEVSGGEEVFVYINIENQNNTPILDADLIMDFPTGVVLTDERGNSVRRWRETIGNIGIGERVTKKYNPVFFGEEGEIKPIKITLEYKIEGSNALVSKSINYDFLVKTAPVVVEVLGPAEVSVGGQAAYEIIIKSKSPVAINDVGMILSHSFGFEPDGFSPNPDSGDNYWRLGTLQPGSERKISVSGKFSGFEGDQKILAIFVGSGRDIQSGSLSTVFLEKQVAINLTRPFLSANFVVNSSYSDEPVVSPGGVVNVDLTVKNNLSDPLEDVEIKVRINGNLHDESSISVAEGFYRSLDKVLLWNQRTVGDLSSILPGASRQLSFSFRLKSDGDYGFNRQFNMEVIAVGMKPRSGFGLEQISFSDQKIVRIASKIQATAEGFYKTGPFTSVGVLPPKVDQETHYTIRLKIGGSSNDLKNVTARANFPVYVKWLGEIIPFGSNVRFSPLDNNLVWDVGDISAGEEEELYFRISLVPSLSQVGREVVLVRSLRGEAVDVFSGEIQNFQNYDITTRVKDVSYEESRVQR